MKKLVSIAVLTTVLAGCATTTKDAGYGSAAIGEEPLVATESLNDSYLMSAAPKYYIGNAYKVEDVQYIPAEDFTYNQIGIAGVIPSDLDGKKTSNGEIYDGNQLLATSKTLPLPTIARVTNLDNGASVVVRINNRGPFVNNRIIDLSAAAAKQIGVTGNTRVQVQVLAEQSKLVKDATIGAKPAASDTEAATVTAAPVTVAAAGEYSIQLAAFYSEDSANDLANQMKKYGDTIVVNEGGLYKVRIVNLDATSARSTIDALRTGEGLAPGLLKSGRWVNPDSI